MNQEEMTRRLNLSLSEKILHTQEKIRDWYEFWNGKVYISFSGGKDSTVLLHLVRQIYPNVPAVFINTGLEFPEIKKFIDSIENVVTIRGKMPFNKVVEKYGYPVISKENAQKIDEIRRTKSDKLRNKRLYGDEKGNGKLPEKWKFVIDSPFKVSNKCCDVLKKRPVKKYEKDSGRKPFIGTMVQDSRLRKTAYMQKGCNAFMSKRPTSTPMAFWKEEEIWKYIRNNNLEYSSIYDMGWTKTGCAFCMFGIHMENKDSDNRFQRMKKTHPVQYKYCIEKLGCGNVMDFLGIDY